MKMMITGLVNEPNRAKRVLVTPTSILPGRTELREFKGTKKAHLFFPTKEQRQEYALTLLLQDSVGVLEDLVGFDATVAITKAKTKLKAERVRKALTEPGTRVRWTGTDGGEGTVDETGGVSWDDGTFCPKGRMDLKLMEVID